MAKVVVVGGGLVGLGGAIMLARDGHEVTVIERDPAVPPPPEEAWASWERRSVNQFRMAHYLLPRYRHIAEAEFPEVIAGLVAAGGLRFNSIDGIPDAITGGRRSDDDRFALVTARRPVIESVIAGVAEAQEGCDVRRGVTVKALRVNDGRVDGVVLDDGAALTADVVVDAGGRRSAMAGLVEAAGFAPPIEDRHDLGFVYFNRHFRSADGTLPPMFGPPLQHYESFSTATLPADNGHWAVLVIASGEDKAARALRDPQVWERVVRSCPLVAHWIDAEPIDDEVQSMAAIEDRYRHFCPGGVPAAPGLLPLGDAFACTNPSVGRGISIGTMHAVALRDLLREADVGDAVGLSLAWDEVCEGEIGGYVHDTLFFDGHRLAEIRAQIAGRPYETDDPMWARHQTLFGHSGANADLLRGVMEIMSVLGRFSDVVARPEMENAIDAFADKSVDPMPGPSRAELLTLLG